MTARISSPSAAESMRRKIEHNWAVLEGAKKVAEEQGDDAATRGVLLDTSFTREGSDIEKLSLMLKDQTETSNQYIARCSELETEIMKMTIEDKAREKRFQDTMTALSLTKEDNTDLKRKMALVQEQTQRAAEEAERARVDAAIKQREIDDLMSTFQQIQDEVGHLKKERDDAKREAERAAKEKRALEEELTRAREDDSVRAAERRADLDLASKEAASARSRVGPLEAELKAERLRSQELNEALKGRTDELKLAQQQLAEAKSALHQQKDRGDRAVASERDLQRELDEKNLQLAQSDARVQSASELVAANEAEMKEMRREKSEIVQALKEKENEMKELKAQLDAVGGDLHAQAMSRRAEREHVEQKMRDLQQALDEAQRELRSAGRGMAEASAQKEQAFAEQRRQLEDMRTRLQDDNVQLRETLAAYQRDQAARQIEFQNEREAYEERLAELTRRQRQAEAQLSTRDLAAGEEVTKLREKLLDSQQQLTQRTRHHIDTLGSLQDTVHKMATECQRVHAAHDALLDEVELMRAAIRDYSEKGAAPIEDWYGDTKRAIQNLVDGLEQAEQEARDAREHQIMAEQQRDEERGRTFMLEEERSRLEDEIRGLEERMRGLDKSLGDKIRKSQMDLEAALAAKADADAALRKSQDQIERSNSTGRAIQGDLERAQQALEETSVRSRDKIAQLEDRIARLEAGIVQADAERDAAVAEQHLLRKKVEGQAKEVADLAQEIKNMETQKRGAGLEESRELAEYQRKYHVAMENVHKGNAQNTSLRSLIQVLTSQRAQAQEENKQLKEQLNELMSRALNDRARSAGVQFLEGDDGRRSVGGGEL